MPLYVSFLQMDPYFGPGFGHYIFENIHVAPNTVEAMNELIQAIKAQPKTGDGADIIPLTMRALHK